MTAETDAQIVLRIDRTCSNSNCRQIAENPGHIFCGYCGTQLPVQRIINGDIPRHSQAETIEIMEKILPLIGKFGHIPEGELRLDDNFAGRLGLDWGPSSDNSKPVGFIMEIEAMFDIPDIPESELPKIVTVRDLCNYILTVRNLKTH